MKNRIIRRVIFDTHNGQSLLIRALTTTDKFEKHVLLVDALGELAKGYNWLDGEVEHDSSEHSGLELSRRIEEMNREDYNFYGEKP